MVSCFISIVMDEMEVADFIQIFWLVDYCLHIC